jgi:hypothetical protein
MSDEMSDRVPVEFDGGQPIYEEEEPTLDSLAERLSELESDLDIRLASLIDRVIHLERLVEALQRGKA